MTIFWLWDAVDGLALDPTVQRLNDQAAQR
jgi:hypothetical protein